MSLGARAALFVALLAALSGVAATGHVAASLDSTSPHSLVSTSPQLDDTTSDTNLTLVVDVQSDGDARWTVSTSFNLTSEAERDSFRALADSFENGETSDLGLTAFRRASQEASEVTGREMEIVDEERRSSPDRIIENGTGRLVVEFTWTNFGQTDEDRLRVDDVFETGRDGGTWLPGLDHGDTFVVRAPEGYGVADSNVPPKIRDNRSTLRWTGPATFNASVLEAEFTGQGLETPTQTPPGNPQGSVPWPLVFVLGLGGGVVVVYLLARHQDGFDLPPTPADSGSGGDPPSAGDPSAGVDTARTATADPAESENEGPEIDEELLSDEERVERLLEHNGGRMKQANIVKETGWSNAKVSQLLSSMEDEGRINKLRIGRENLISFPEEDVTDIEE